MVKQNKSYPVLLRSSELSIALSAREYIWIGDLNIRKYFVEKSPLTIPCIFSFQLNGCWWRPGAGAICHAYWLCWCYVAWPWLGTPLFLPHIVNIMCLRRIIMELMSSQRPSIRLWGLNSSWSIFMCATEEMDGKRTLKNRTKIISLTEGTGWLVLPVNLWLPCEPVDVEDTYCMIGVT